jgi:hypothetical protein
LLAKKPNSHDGRLTILVASSRLRNVRSFDNRSLALVVPLIPSSLGINLIPIVVANIVAAKSSE